MGNAAAIVLAGGSGSRVGADRNKVYLPLGERSVLGWSLRAFVRHPAIGPVVLVARAEDGALAEHELAALSSGTEPTCPDGQLRSVNSASGDDVRRADRWPDPVPRPAGAGSAVPPVVLVTGGGTRQESELRGLRHLAPGIAAGDIDVVLVHDGARPLVSDDLITAVLDTARACGGAVPGVLRADIGAATVDGTGLRWPPATGAVVAVQTPQGFRAGPLLTAYEEADRHGFVGTDTASCVQRFTDLEVRWVPSDQRNLKITYAHDMALAEHAVRHR